MSGRTVTIDGYKKWYNENAALHKLQGVQVGRLEPWNSSDGFGHYWIEVGGRGYGWWPDPQAGPWEWGSRGVKGQFADGNDSYGGVRTSKIKIYDVFVSGAKNMRMQTHSYITNKMRAISGKYGNYGIFCDCRTFQHQVARELGWTLKIRK